MSQLGDEFEFRSEMWKFEILRNPKLVEIAADEALEADVIIVAARGATALPLEVTSWIDRWLPLRVECAGALIAQIQGGTILNRAATSVYDYLQKVAAAAKMDFLPHFLTGAEEKSPSIAAPLAAKVSSPRWDEWMERPGTERHWGINE